MRTIICVLVIGISSTVDAGGFRRSSQSSCNYCKPAIVKKVIVEEVIRERLVQPVYQNIYYAVGESVRDYAMQPEYVALAEQGQLQREMERLQERIQQYSQMRERYAQRQQAYYTPPQPAQLPAYQPQRQVEQCPGPQAQESCPGPDQPTFSQQERPQQRVTEQACLKCHSGPNAKAGLRMDQPLSFKQKLGMLHNAATGEMPKDGRDLTDAELERFIDEHFDEGEQRLLSRILDGEEPAQLPAEPERPRFNQEDRPQTPPQPAPADPEQMPAPTQNVPPEQGG